MSIPSRPVHSGTFLITTATHERRRLFQLPANADLLVETLQHYRREGCFLLHAFVVMPEHIHLLLTPQQIALERAVGLIKGSYSHHIASKRPVWQRGFTDRRVRDSEEFANYKTYIHENPVRKALCETAADYRWSSAWSGWRKDGNTPHREIT